MASTDKKMSPEQMEARMAKLEEENEILRREKVKGKNDYTGMMVDGSIQVVIEDTESGNKEKKKVEFVPGAVWCRLSNGEKVWSEDLMALANGKKLSEEAAQKSPALVGMDQKKAAEWITTLARRGATFLRTVGAVLLLLLVMLSATTAIEAQNFRSGHLEYFTVDTLTDAGSITLLPSKSATGFDQYDYSWQVTTTNISGTTAGSIIVEESLYASGNYWTAVDTVAISEGNQIVSGTLGALRQRVRVVGTGTQSTQVRVAALFRRKEF